MWLEELVWLWLPIAVGAGIWMVWSIVALKREVRALHHRLAQIETTAAARAEQESMAT
jgi:hypothetical protein